MTRALNEYLMNISSKIASDFPQNNISFETYLTNSHAEMGVMSLSTGQIVATLKMLENYPNARKPMINGLFCHARGCFKLRFRIYQNL